MCRATWGQPPVAADGAPQKKPVSNRGPSIRHGKKDIIGEKESFKDCFSLTVLSFVGEHFFETLDDLNIFEIN